MRVFVDFSRLRAAAVAFALMGALGCASASGPAPAAPAAPPTSANEPAAPDPAPETGAAAAAELPDGRGKQILLASCTSCHDLREVTKLRGYYNRSQWRDIVVTMVEYGAEVGKQDVEVLADYLAEHLGPTGEAKPLNGNDVRLERGGGSAPPRQRSI